MSLSAAIKIEIDNMSIGGILECLLGSGLDIRDGEGKTDFLPAGDNGRYAWQAESLTDTQINALIKTKSENKETAGFSLYKDSICCTDILFFPSNEIIISCDINRRTVELKSGVIFTDINRYVNMFIAPLINKGYRIVKFEYEEIY